MTDTPPWRLASAFDMTGRVVVVTGGTRGIGLALAEAYVDLGARVVVASRKAEACREVEERLRARGGDALGVPIHLGELDDLGRLVETAVAAYGGIDVVVNNAANALALPIGGLTPAAWSKSFDVNLRGPVFLVEAALPHLRASEHAAVLNVLSVGAFMFAPSVSMYAAAKAALLSFTRSSAAELAGDGIRVNALAPGATDTDMTRNTGVEGMARLAEAPLLGRLAQSSEMVGPALLLTSDAGSYITGQTLIVDGGLVPR